MACECDKDQQISEAVKNGFCDLCVAVDNALGEGRGEGWKRAQIWKCRQVSTRSPSGLIREPAAHRCGI